MTKKRSDYDRLQFYEHQIMELKNIVMVLKDQNAELIKSLQEIENGLRSLENDGK